MENKDLKDINLKNYNAVCLAPWMMNSIKNLNFDMFINVASFQEMEPMRVQNYINILSPKIRKIIYPIKCFNDVSLAKIFLYRICIYLKF